MRLSRWLRWTSVLVLISLWSTLLPVGLGFGPTSVAAQTLPAISINDISVTEGHTGSATATLTVSLSAASASTVSVTYATANGAAPAATQPADYTQISATVLTFAPGVVSQSVTVTI